MGFNSQQKSKEIMNGGFRNVLLQDNVEDRITNEEVV